MIRRLRSHRSIGVSSPRAIAGPAKLILVGIGLEPVGTDDLAGSIEPDTGDGIANFRK